MEYTIINNYLDYCKHIKRLSNHTIRAYKNDLMGFYNFNSEHIDTYLEHLTFSTTKSSTLKRKIASLKTFYAYLEQHELITNNPFHQRRFQFKAEKTLPKIISKSELKLIFEFLTSKYDTAATTHSQKLAYRNKLIISLLLATGIRISELCQLKMKNIDLENRTISILGKGKKERIIYLGDNHTISFINFYLQQYHQTSSNYLFPGKNAEHPIAEQTIRLLLKNISEELNLSKKITPICSAILLRQCCLIVMLIFVISSIYWDIVQFP